MILEDLPNELIHIMFENLDSSDVVPFLYYCGTHDCARLRRWRRMKHEAPILHPSPRWNILISSNNLDIGHVAVLGSESTSSEYILIDVFKRTPLLRKNIEIAVAVPPLRWVRYANARMNSQSPTGWNW
jgi:hypothetical protein